MPSELSPEKFSEWGHQASREYLENGVPLNKTISKLAGDNGLTPQQISRVVESANIDTYGHMFNTSQDKNFHFDVAHLNEIVSSLEEVDEPAKTADSYESAPRPIREDFNVNKVFGIGSISNRDSVLEKKARAENAVDLIKAAKQEIADKFSSVVRARVETEEDLYKVAKQMVMNDVDIKDIIYACQEATKADNDYLLTTFKKIAHKLAKEGVYGAAMQLKTAEAVGEELISTDLSPTTEHHQQVRVVNGNHPVITLVNTLVEQISEEDRLRHATLLLDGKAQYVTEKIQFLNNSLTTDAFVDQQQENAGSGLRGH